MKVIRRFFQKAFGRISLTVLVLLFQISWLVIMYLKLSDYYIFVSGLMSIATAIIAIYIANKRDNPVYKMGWITLILVVPILGVILYLMFGHDLRTKRVKKRFEIKEKQFSAFLPKSTEVMEEIREYDKQVGNICRYLDKIAGYPIYRNQELQYLSTGEEAIEKLKEELKKAEKFIFMEYFIIEPDGIIFNEILDILEEKVKNGVEVRLLYDDFGSVAYVGKKDFRKIKARGINIRRFNPIRTIAVAFMNNRDHRKITVIDGKTAFTGGFNLADEYANIDCPYGVWKDTGIMVRGAAVDSFTGMFLSMWNSVSNEDKEFDMYFSKCQQVSLEEADGYIQPYSDTPLDHEKVGEDVYLNIIKTAYDYVYMYTPYLIIDEEMSSELCLAAKSGIDVRIITPGIPDKKMVYLVTQSYYSQLIDAGVKIYQYTPGFVHAKVFISDDEIATVGSINMDYRSLYLHFECGAFMYKCKEIKQIKKDFEDVLSKSTEITKEFVDNRNIFIRGAQVLFRLFSPLL